MDIKQMQKEIIKFRDDRDWKQFHNFKDVAISLVLEATEVLEHTQWKTKEEFEEYIKSSKMKDLEDELIDVLYWILLLSYDLKVDLATAFKRKMNQNHSKYPIDKAKGTHKKYTELEEV